MNKELAVRVDEGAVTDPGDELVEQNLVAVHLQAVASQHTRFSITGGRRLTHTRTTGNAPAQASFNDWNPGLRMLVKAV